MSQQARGSQYRDSQNQQDWSSQGGRRHGNQYQNQNNRGNWPRRGNWNGNQNFDRNNYQQQRTAPNQFQRHSEPHSQVLYSQGQQQSGSLNEHSRQSGQWVMNSNRATALVSMHGSMTKEMEVQTTCLESESAISIEMSNLPINPVGFTDQNIDSKVMCSGYNFKSIKVTSPNLAFDQFFQRVLETHPDRENLVLQLVQLPNVQIEKLKNHVTQTHSLSPEATPFEYHQQSSDPGIAKVNTVHANVDHNNYEAQDQERLSNSGENCEQTEDHPDSKEDSACDEKHSKEDSACDEKQDGETVIEHEEQKEEWWDAVKEEEGEPRVADIQEERNANDARGQPQRNEAGGRRHDNDNNRRQNEAGRGGRREYNNLRNPRNQRRDGNKRTYKKVQEVSGDLFEASKDISLAHCVAEDLRMGSGIAVTFRQMFKKVPDLLDQKKKVGQVAVLKAEDRYIYYLITKKISNGKPFIEDIEKSLKEMKKHCEENGVKKLAMPRIGCGLDRLEWSDVKPMIEDIFSDLEIDITVYNFNADKEDTNNHIKPKAFFKTAIHPLVDIATETGLVFFGTMDGSIDECGQSLDKKFNFMFDYRKEAKQVGNVLLFQKKMEYLYGFVIKNKETDAFLYVNLEKCLLELRKRVKKDKTYFIGFQAFSIDGDDLTMEKFITVVRNVFYMHENEIHFCYPKELEYLQFPAKWLEHEDNRNYPGVKKDFTGQENKSNISAGGSERKRGGTEFKSWRADKS